MALPTPEQHEVIGAEALFRAHAGFVASFLRRMSVPDADVDDLVQEVFVIAHRKGGYVPGPAQPRTWLGAIALRVAQSGRRSRQRHPSVPGDVALDAASEDLDPAEQLETQRALLRVQRALEQLSLEHRATFVLFEIEGESCENIATALQVPLGTVYSRLHTARRRFLSAYETAAVDHAGPAQLPLPGRELCK
jgi:RNA polymerase sigma-70 factor (ECF subfamily)